MRKDFVFQAKRDNLPEILKTVSDAFSPYVSDEILFARLKLCVEEIVVNIADYAYSDKGGMVYISCDFDENTKILKLDFADEGMPYNPLENQVDVDIDADISDRKIGGLGIFLYTTIMDTVEYRYENGKNHLMTTKYVEKV